MTQPRRPWVRVRALTIGAVVLVAAAVLALARFGERPAAPVVSARSDAPPAPTPAALATAPAPAAGTPVPPVGGALSVLLRQAEFWRGQRNDEQALASLDRAQRLAPDGADVLALRAAVLAEQGDRAAAGTALARLRQVAPGDARIAAIEQAIATGALPPKPATEAVATAPPDTLAVDTLVALASAEGGYEQAKQGLARLVRQDPKNLGAQLGYARVLVLRDADRAEGIIRLAALSHDPTVTGPATQSWREALLRLPDGHDAVLPLETYLATHPDDTAVAAKLGQAHDPLLTAAPAVRARAQGYAALDAGRLSEAATLLQQAIDADSGDADAVGGLGLVRLREHDPAAAKPLLSRAVALDPAHAGRWRSALASASRDSATATATPVRHGARPPARERAVAVREQAAVAGDPPSQPSRFAAAAANDPDNPWLRLDQARALARLGRTREARQVMADALDAAPSPDALRAGIVFANETSDPDAAAALIERLPPQQRTAEMRALQSQAALQRMIGGLLLQPRPEARDRLLALAAVADPQGTRGAAIARALAGIGERAAAGAAVAAAQAATPDQGAPARLRYAAALLDSDAPAAADAMLAPVTLAELPSAEDRQDYRRVAAALAARTADTLGATPDATGPASAHARSRSPREALERGQSALRSDPGDAEARRATVAAALLVGDRALAETLVREGVHLAPNDPRMWLMSAELARAGGRNGRALRDLRHARDLRRQELGEPDTARPTAEPLIERFMPALSVPPMLLERGTQSEPAPTEPIPDEPAHGHLLDTRPVDVPPPSADQMNGQELGPDALAPPAPPPHAEANPFREGPGDTLAAAAPARPDALTQEIDRAIVAARAAVAPGVQAGFVVRSRSGGDGAERLTELAIPLEATYAPGGTGQLRLAVTPTRLQAGAGGSASGVGLDLAYRLPELSADLGAAPVGFREQTVLGGVEWAPRLGENLRARLTAERRAVGDSLVAEAGAVDPRTGTTFGGVVRNHARASLELSAGKTDYYVAAGGALLTGDHVRDNRELEFGAGASRALYETATQTLRAGLDLGWFAYAKNLRYATLGQGGYFSPQSYVAAMVPVSFTNQVSDDLVYDVGAAVGFERFREAESPYYPRDPALGAGRYAARRRSGFAGRAQAGIDYRVAPNLHLGGRLAFQHTTHFDESAGTVYARYLFDGADE